MNSEKKWQAVEPMFREYLKINREDTAGHIVDTEKRAGVEGFAAAMLNLISQHKASSEFQDAYVWRTRLWLNMCPPDASQYIVFTAINGGKAFIVWLEEEDSNELPDSKRTVQPEMILGTLIKEYSRLRNTCAKCKEYNGIRSLSQPSSCTES